MLRYCFIISLVFLASVECRTVYIATSDAVCPIASSANNSCMTLTQIAASSTAALTTESNLTVIFLPGNHTLNATNFSLTMIPHVVLVGCNRYIFSWISPCIGTHANKPNSSSWNSKWSHLLC